MKIRSVGCQFSIYEVKYRSACFSGRYEPVIVLPHVLFDLCPVNSASCDPWFLTSLKYSLPFTFTVLLRRKREREKGGSLASEKQREGKEGAVKRNIFP